MNSAYELNTVYIKNSGVTDQELAVVAERASELQEFRLAQTGHENIMQQVH